MAKDSFILYDNYIENLECLSDEQIGVLFKSIFSARNNKQLPNMDSAVKMAYSFMMSQIKRDAEKYNNICALRSAAGSKGGAPKGNQNATKQPKQANACIDNQSEEIIKNNQNKQMLEKTSKTTKNNQNKHNDIDIEYDYKKKVNNKLFTKKEKQPPTREEVVLYAKERGREELAQNFYDFFTLGNWHDSNGKPVLNWKQKFITWETNTPKQEKKKSNSIHFENERKYSNEDFQNIFTNVDDI